MLDHKPGTPLLAILAALFVLTATLGQVSAQDASAAPPPQITFVGYNIKNWLPMDRRIDGELVEDAPKPEEEKAALITLLATTKPDIVGICEIGSRADLEDLQARLKAAGHDLPHLEWFQASDPYRHVAAISKFPVVATDHQAQLSYHIDDKKLPFSRGILDATLQVTPDYQLRILGLHLKSKREVPEADQALMRRNEAHLVRRHADAILAANPETNLLVYGDLNDHRIEPPVKALQGRYGSDAYLRDIQFTDTDGYRWTYFWRYGDQYSRFDFALVSKGLYPEVILDDSYIAGAGYKDWYLASDHRPIVLKIHPADKQTK